MCSPMQTAPPRQRGMRDAINGTFMFFFIVITGLITNILQFLVFVLIRPLFLNFGRVSVCVKVYMGVSVCVCVI